MKLSKIDEKGMYYFIGKRVNIAKSNKASQCHQEKTFIDGYKQGTLQQTKI